LRLGVYLFWRWANHGADRRYAKLAERAKQKHGLNFALFSLLWVFAPQLVLQFIVVAARAARRDTTHDRTEAARQHRALARDSGIIFEAIADAQLAHFKSLEANKGKVMDQGLWRYSRHPNYFGDMVAWWGMWLIALDAGMGLWSIPGPLLLTFLLTRVSGGPDNRAAPATHEAQSTKPTKNAPAPTSRCRQRSNMDRRRPRRHSVFQNAQLAKAETKSRRGRRRSILAKSSPRLQKLRC
jgi:steroid 5-alpha reductase family enzyme